MMNINVILIDYFVVAVIALCAILGYIIKTGLDFIPNKYIPIIVTTVGILLNVWANGGVVNLDIVLGGAISGIASTGCHSAIKSLTESNE